MAVTPGDVVVGDAEGVVVIPAHLAEEVAHGGYEQEIREEFFQEKVAGGASIIGVYPPSDETLTEYEQWRRETGHIAGKIWPFLNHIGYSAARCRNR